jgi:ABC-2 type transport system ATP-binding protein
MSVLSVQNLHKSFHGKPAVSGVSFSVGRNEIVGLLGPNGAGKTTTINMVLGILDSDQGAVSIDGHDIRRERRKALERTNFAAVYAPLPGNLTLRENLRYFSLLYNIKDRAARVGEVMDLFDLRDMEDKRFGLLSSGQQTRAALAKAFLNRPHLLLLDEPTASLDPATARDIRGYIKQFAAEGESGVLWTSHNMKEVEEVCDRVLFLSRGKILLEGNPRTLAAQNGMDNLEDLFVAIAREPLREGGPAMEHAA